ncbi:unnamed protein product [Aureobasidium uvarum]|uniref:Uncharacterized protein n=1 Tax=Aureobasidium uvarum TaxID=2773716 RepID=A0A9N8KNB5_9PEZI|nr:unnamed protein product [Aureobasidium uvarum]
MTKRREKRIEIDAARENLRKLNTELSDQIACRKQAGAVPPGSAPRIEGVWTRSEVRMVHYGRSVDRSVDRSLEYIDAVSEGVPVDFARELKRRLAPHRKVPLAVVIVGIPSLRTAFRADD